MKCRDCLISMECKEKTSVVGGYTMKLKDYKCSKCGYIKRVFLA